MTADLDAKRFALGAIFLGFVGVLGVIGTVAGAGAGAIVAAILFLGLAGLMLRVALLAKGAFVIDTHGVTLRTGRRLHAQWHEVGEPYLETIALNARGDLSYYLTLPPPDGDLDGRKKLQIPLAGIKANPDDILAAALSASAPQRTR